MNEGYSFRKTEGVKESTPSLCLNSSVGFLCTGHIAYEALDILDSFATL